jgi:hypothetical protein
VCYLTASSLLPTLLASTRAAVAVTSMVPAAAAFLSLSTAKANPECCASAKKLRRLLVSLSS